MEPYAKVEAEALKSAWLEWKKDCAMFGYSSDTIFTNEDTLKAFIDAMSAHQRAALYELLYNSGCRYTGTALERWRKERR